MAKNRIEDELTRRRTEHRYRRRRTLQSPQAIEVRIDGRELLSFCSNDYLGLADRSARCWRRSRRRRAAAASAAAPRTWSPAMPPRITRSRKNWRDFAGDRARAAVLDRLHGQPRRRWRARSAAATTVFEDKLNHASLIDAAR
ncbi:MAG: hypothetical protein MZV65_20470 [Chromatiales bacterium]|nr:hypothetical protein [Chromatiales bacterium]